ncbi:hypothetical protein Tel_07900 [Candidatus Tenderia electrophaga]|uniref:Uncharacterized protein n=1 Tax=Candidatus Tenderia electrophaga TaxID=1748243 RepID=A0A0S2TD45_9GAMM|nr:hypothetical protein Tel_07900 [Candidatus Tenderia electrophaga]
MINSWYKTPDSQTFRVTAADLDEGFIQIQYADGSFEGLDSDIWAKLGAEEIEPNEEWLEQLDEDLNELDFYELGGAPGSEAFDMSEYYD